MGSKSRPQLVAQVKKAKRALARARKALAAWKPTPKVPEVWHPLAQRVPLPSAGAWAISCPARIVWHTTEAPRMFTFRDGSQPHMQLDPSTGALVQYVPLNEAAKALEHPAGTVQTNHAHAIQVELVGFAAATGEWPQAWYDRINALARWIEANAGVARRCGVTFTDSAHVKRMTDREWLEYRGHCGHQHVPHQPSGHWDPGELRIEEVLQ
jgi:hypothetical protein